MRPGKRSDGVMNFGDLSSRTGHGLCSKSRAGTVCAEGVTVKQKTGIKLSGQVSGHILRIQAMFTFLC